MDPEGTLRIGQLARSSGVGIETLRYYEKVGLLPRPRRSASGYRQYPAATLSRLRFIKAAQAVGFTLREVRELLALRVFRGQRCEEVHARAAAKLRDVDERLVELQRIRAALAQLVASCSQAGAAARCAFLDAIDNEGEDHGPG